MMKLLCLATFLAITSGQYFKPTPAPYAPFPVIKPAYQPYKPIQYFRPTPAPYAPLSYYRPTPAPYAPLPVAPIYTKSGEAAAAILRLENDAQPDGSFRYAYETQNGIAAQATGIPKPIGNEAPVVVQGSYQYASPEGPVSVSYVADENGYQPSSDILPTPHPIPEAILRSIQFNEANERTVRIQPVYRQN